MIAKITVPNRQDKVLERDIRLKGNNMLYPLSCKFFSFERAMYVPKKKTF